jgi:hypothetical protein
MRVSTFEAAVRARTGLMDGPRFRAAVRESLVALAGHVGVPWGRLRAVLPRPLFDALCEAGLEPLDVRSAGQRVSEAAELHVRIAAEILAATLAELGERLGADGRDELRGVLPRAWAELVVEPDTAAPSAAANGAHPRAAGSGSASARGIVK